MDIGRIGYSEGVKIQSEQKLTGSSQLLSNVKVGEILKGTLNQLPSGQVVLTTESGKIPVQLDGEALLNETVALKVLQKQEGQILLQLLSENGDEVPLSLGNKIMEVFNLPKSSAMKQLIEHFLDKQLPVEREALLKAYHMSKTFDIPAETLANFEAQQAPLSIKDANQMYLMKETNLSNVLNEVTDLLVRTNSSQCVKNIYTALSECLNQADLDEMFKEIKSLIKNIDLKVNILESSNPMFKQPNIEKPSDYEMPVYNQEAQEFLKANGRNDEKIQDLLEKLLFKMPKEQWEILGRVTKKFLQKAMSVDLNALEVQPKVDHKTFDKQHKLLENLTKALADLNLDKKGTQVLKHLEEAKQIVEKFNMQGEYHFFSLNLPKGEGKGELYFFKPKKKTSHQEKNHLYVVLALALPMLQKLEVHIRQEEDKALVHFKLKEKLMIDLFESRMNALKQGMQQTSLQLEEVTFSLLDEKEDSNKQVQNSHQMSHMDFKI